MVPGKTSDNDYVVIDLDSGKVYTMDVKDKSYEVKILYKRNDLPVPAPQEIAGYKTTVVIQQNGREKEDDFLAYLNNGIFYVADDLYYSVPHVYEINSELMMIKNGRIVLAGDVGYTIIANGQWNLNTTIGWAKRSQYTANVMATSITPMKMDSSLFIVPAGFMERSEKSLIDEQANAQKNSLDSIRVPRAQMVPKMKPSKPLQKKTPLAKPSAVRRKKD